MSPVEVFATRIKIFDRQMCAWLLDRPIKSSWLLDFSWSSEVSLIPWSALKKGLIQFDPDRKYFYTGHISDYPPPPPLLVLALGLGLGLGTGNGFHSFSPSLKSDKQFVLPSWPAAWALVLSMSIDTMISLEPEWCKCNVMQLSPCTYTIRKMPGTQPKWKWKQMFNWKFVLEREDYRCA